MKTHPDDSPRVSICLPNQPWSQTAFFNANSKTEYSASFQLNPTPDLGFTDNYKKPQADATPLNNSQIANSQSSQAASNLDSKQSEANGKLPLSQYLPVILQFFKFLEKQLANPLSLVLGGAFVLVILAMLLGQMSSGGIRIKLDLQVSPNANQIEKSTEAK